jgi:O-antigen/teichoic acid export membrane protein
VRLAVPLKTSQRKYVRNVLAHLGGIYGAKGFELVTLAAVTRVAPLAEVGAVFFSVAFGNALFQVTDFGLYPVLFRRAAREQAGPRLLAWATLLRALVLVLLTVPFAVVARAKFSELASLATVFFVLGGLRVVHEVPRAILAGRQRFPLLATAGLVTKGLEAAVTVGGVVLGGGIWALAAGRAAQNLGMLGAGYALARREVRGFPSPAPRAIVREGLPFWFVTAIGSALGQLDTILVGAYLGLSETARLGIATRVVGAALSVVSAMVSVAFPDIARENRRFPSRPQIVTVLWGAVVLTLPVLVAAPLVVHLVTGRPDPEAVMVVRALSPILAFAVLERALTTWLQAKNKERAMAVTNVVSAVAGALALVFFIPAFKTLGAAYSRIFREAVSAAALLALAYVTSHRISRLLPWVLSLLPGARTLLRSRLEATTEQVAARCSEDADVVGVEIAGSAGDPSRFEPGASDLDFVVTTRAVGERLGEVVKHCDRVAARVRFTGHAHAQVLHPDVLLWARAAGYPVLSAKRVRPLRGPAVTPDVDAASARAWALTHAVTLAIRAQAYAVEDSRDDGSVRSDRVVKELRFLFQRLYGDDSLAVLEALRKRGHTAPGFLVHPRSAPAWLPSELAAELLLAAHEELDRAFAEACATWTARAAHPSAPAPWLDPVRAVARQRVDSLPVLDGAAVHLTPTGPTEDDPMLVVVPGTWSRQQWMDWIRENSALGRLPLPFRSSRWPAVLPPSVLRGDTLIEHAALFHLSRRSGSVDLRGTTPVGSEPPSGALRAAARREILQALIRIPRDRTRVAALPVFRPRELLEPQGLFDAWPFRVRAYVGGRLASLSLILDHGVALGDRASVRDAYLARYDDPLAAFLRDDPSEATGKRIAMVLDAWAAERMERLSGGAASPRVGTEPGRTSTGVLIT